MIKEYYLEAFSVLTDIFNKIIFSTLTERALPDQLENPKVITISKSEVRQRFRGYSNLLF